MASPRNESTEPFPSISEDPSSDRPAGSSPPRRTSTFSNRTGASPSLSGRMRRASQSFSESGPPVGFAAATGNIASSIAAGQKAPAVSNGHATATPATTNSTTASGAIMHDKVTASTASEQAATINHNLETPAVAAAYANGYHFPPSKSFGLATKDGLKAFWAYFTTPLGFIVTIYGLNIVAWGGMLFLILCGAAPAMCTPSCNDDNSPRQKWIEWDSQILNALFCVTGFGLAPWRARDLWYLLKYRMRKDQQALQRLAGIHRGWFRLPGSSALPTDIGPKNIVERQASEDQANIPFPPEKIPDPPLTGVRARDSKIWKLDLVIWLMIWNTIFQAFLAGFMWGMNRFDRPPWTTGLFVALACIVAGVGGYVMFREGKIVKSQEGVPLTEKDLARLDQDRERGIYHYNNVKDKDLEAKKAAKEEKKAKKQAKKEAKKSSSSG